MKAPAFVAFYDYASKTNGILPSETSGTGTNKKSVYPGDVYKRQILGCALGSFTDCLAGRMLNGTSVLKGRSHCDACGHVLGVLDLVPLFSRLCLRGRCRYCGAKIPAEAF